MDARGVGATAHSGEHVDARPGDRQLLIGSSRLTAGADARRLAGSRGQASGQDLLALVTVGAVVSSTKAWLRMAPSLPAVSVTLT